MLQWWLSSPLAALQRELAEELGIQVTQSEFFCSTNHDYPDLNVAIEFFLVRDWQGEPAGKEGQKLKWVSIDDLNVETVLPADAPVIDRLKTL